MHEQRGKLVRFQKLKIVGTIGTQPSGSRLLACSCWVYVYLLQRLHAARAHAQLSSVFYCEKKLQLVQAR
jgi:hypothetical protein